MSEPDPIERLAMEVQAAPKYRAISTDFVRKVAAQELSHHKQWKDAVKATRSKLHQVGGAYLDPAPDFARWTAELASLPADPHDPALRAACLKMLKAHASTRERIPILEEFFATTLGSITPVDSVLDLACGLTPLCAPWMPLADGAIYTACDIYPEMVAFGEGFLKRLGYQAQAMTCDLTTQPLNFPRTRVAFLLKTLPCLEQVEKGITLRLLEALPAEYILVSFPARSLGGRSKGMPENYGSAFRTRLDSTGWEYKAYEFSSELAFLVRKSGGQV
jgi:16S rRNA (guanine(1405)-N(7))-methyltransferase